MEARQCETAGTSCTRCTHAISYARGFGCQERGKRHDKTWPMAGRGDVTCWACRTWRPRQPGSIQRCGRLATATLAGRFAAALAHPVSTAGGRVERHRGTSVRRPAYGVSIRYAHGEDLDRWIDLYFYPAGYLSSSQFSETAHEEADGIRLAHREAGIQPSTWARCARFRPVPARRTRSKASRWTWVSPATTSPTVRR